MSIPPTDRLNYAFATAPSTRAEILLDGAAYFSELTKACRQAEYSIYIAGWEIDFEIDSNQQSQASHQTLKDFC